jgi:anti-sigma factor RsiW
MKDKWNDIINHTSDHIDEQMLMDYLEGRLSPEEKHRVEFLMSESGFVDDAIEGLAAMKDKQKIATILHELNSKLHQKTMKKVRKYNVLIPDQQTLTIASIITILLLAVIAFVVFKMMQN